MTIYPKIHKFGIGGAVVLVVSALLMRYVIQPDGESVLFYASYLSMLYLMVLAFVAVLLRAEVAREFYPNHSFLARIAIGPGFAKNFQIQLNLLPYMLLVMLLIGSGMFL